MTQAKKSNIGTIAWTDLTVPNATEVKDFYQAVVGWQSSEADMGGYCDYNMVSPDGKTVSGICHAKGANAGLPPQWLVYLVIEDLATSMAECIRLGGKIITEPKSFESGNCAVIQDPAGAVCALYQG